MSLSVSDLRRERRRLQSYKDDGPECGWEDDGDDAERLIFLDALFDALAGDTPDDLVEESEWKGHCRTAGEEYFKGVPEALVACVDWNQWADSMASDYSVVTVDGETYYYQ